MSMRTSPRPVTLLIAALGGEGGGVLGDWIVRAANAQGFPVQSTSIPGVAQRTGATTYYFEIIPVTRHDLGGKQPIFALAPGVGDVDIVLASELLEAGRTIVNGFVTADRTVVIASTHRTYAIAEKIAMGDGRYDSSRLTQVIERHARDHLLFDMAVVARASGAMINAVMLGAIAASGRLPMSVEAFEAAIRAEGKGTEANLRGFRAGLAAARRTSTPRAEDRRDRDTAGSENLKLEPALVATFPASAQPIVIQGIHRLTAYQDADYARLYVARLESIAEADRRAHAGGRLVCEVARHLAVRMSYEDVIRVAQAKIAPERFTRIAEEVGAGRDDPFTVVDFLKPGVEEICQIMPPRIARGILAFADRHEKLRRFHWGMEIESTSIAGFLRFWLLAKLRPWRPRTFRYVHEQRDIEQWLALIVEAAGMSADLAIEISECARLIKGYGDTWHRGMSSYRAIETHVIRPVLARHFEPRRGADAIASARTAALLDPEGGGLSKCIAEIENHRTLPFAAE